MHASIHAKLKIFKNGGEKTTYSCTSDIKNKDAVFHRLIKNSCHLLFVSYVGYSKTNFVYLMRKQLHSSDLNCCEVHSIQIHQVLILFITPISQFKIRKLTVIKEECQGVLPRISGNFFEHFFIRLSTGEPFFIKLLLK